MHLAILTLATNHSETLDLFTCAFQAGTDILYTGIMSGVASKGNSNKCQAGYMWKGQAVPRDDTDITQLIKYTHQAATPAWYARPNRCRAEQPTVWYVWGGTVATYGCFFC